MIKILTILGIIILFIIIILCIILFVEILFRIPIIFFRYILLRDFKIASFTGLSKESKANKQLYVITGVTWFDLPIVYQAHYSSLDDDSGYSVNFIMNKSGWIKKGCKGFTDYKEAKEELKKVKKRYLNEEEEIIWISNIMNEDTL